jgi:CheY-like chemotaxis protein
MKLDYNILWIDDTPTWVKSIEGSLRLHFDELGYRLKITQVKSGDTIEEAIKDPELDLIILDYKLPRITGKDLIETVRSKHVLVEIVFYSQEGNPKDKFESPPDGVYFASREDAEERITNVIDLTLKKALDINNVRGLVIAESIDIEIRLGEVLVQCFGKSGELFRERLLHPKTGLFDFGKKDILLQGILKDKIDALIKRIEDSKGKPMKGAKATLAKLQKLKEEYKVFAAEVILPRNTMAHVEKQWDQNGKCILKSRARGGPDIVVDQAWFTKARKDLIKHAENLEKIFKSL